MSVCSTLFLPFENGDLEYPGTDQKSGFWGAHPCSELGNFTHIDCFHNYKAQADMLESNGYSVHAQGQDYDYVLCLTPKQVGESQYGLASALLALKDGGVILAAAANDSGGKRLEGFFKELGLDPQSLSKNKARVVWAHKATVHENVIQQWIAQGAQQNLKLEEEDFISQPGLFSWDEIDPGSKLLIEHLPDLSGVGADFGCGYGYLSRKVLEGNKDIKILHCLDHDVRAIDAAEKNLQAFQNHITLYYHWQDLRVKPDTGLVDWVIMNPPFHTGKSKDEDLGLKFIDNAHQVLKKSGKLYLVANKQLGYERLLEKLFTKTENIYEDGQYKIIFASK